MADSPRQPKIWVDADAVPRVIVEVLVRAADSRAVSVTLVANRWIEKPRSARVNAVTVSKGGDVADDYIVSHCSAGDLIVTHDIPRAARVVVLGTSVLEPNGSEITAADARERLSLRDFHQGLREAGVEAGGSKPFSLQDKQRFANGLDRWLARRAAALGPSRTH